MPVSATLSWNIDSFLSIMGVTNDNTYYNANAHWTLPIEGTGFSHYEIWYDAFYLTDAENRNNNAIGISDVDYPELGTQATFQTTLIKDTPVGFSGPIWSAYRFYALFGVDTGGLYTDPLSIAAIPEAQIMSAAQLTDTDNVGEQGDIKIIYSFASTATYSVWFEFAGLDGRWYPCTNVMPSTDAAPVGTDLGVVVVSSGTFGQTNVAYWKDPALDYGDDIRNTAHLLRITKWEP